MGGELRIEDDPRSSRYEVFVESTRAGLMDYHLQPGLITITHTEVDPAFEGQGVGSGFVGAVLDDVRSRGLRVLPMCPFVRAFIQRHPEYEDIVWRP